MGTHIGYIWFKAYQRGRNSAAKAMIDGVCKHVNHNTDCILNQRVWTPLHVSMWNQTIGPVQRSIEVTK